MVGADDASEAIRLRAGTQGIFTNVVLNDFDEGFDLDGDTGDNPTGQGVLDGDLGIIDVTFNNVTTKLKNDTGYTFTEADLFQAMVTVQVQMFLPGVQVGQWVSTNPKKLF